MPDKRVETNISASSFNCPHCGALAQQTWHMLFARRIGKNGVPLQPTESGLQVLRAQTELDYANATTEVDLENLSRKLEYFQRLDAGEVFFDTFLNTVLTKDVKLPQIANVHASQCYSCEQIAVWAATVWSSRVGTWRSNPTRTCLTISARTTKKPPSYSDPHREVPLRCYGCAYRSCANTSGSEARTLTTTLRASLGRGWTCT